MKSVFSKLLDQEAWDRLQAEAREANKLQEEFPEMTRDEALAIVKKIFDSPKEVRS